MKYDFASIEKKWQQKWLEEKPFTAVTGDKTREKFFGLIEFPYPSGQGLHVGHARPFTAMDIICRKKRMQGYNVLFPIGYDAFGLPTENYAVQHHIHPAKVTHDNIENFRTQLHMLGYSFDWDREVNTTDPSYYKWTQWIFLQMFKKGLAYKASMPVNWCTSCKIVLANEEVVDGVCERCGGQVIRKEKSQWMLAITKYADRLIDDLDDLDFIERVKIQQKNWIGRSEGTEVDSYEVTDTGESPLSKMTDWVNTTCPKCGGPAQRETDTMPQWAGSSWYFLRYMDPHNDKAFASKEALDYWSPVDWYNGGMEHTTLHLLYSRFWHKFLYDIGAVPTKEPYAKRTSHGMILGEGGEKMSKSRGNVVNPNDIVDQYGADTMRLYIMFIGDFEKAATWSNDAVKGSKRFLDRVWNLAESASDSYDVTPANEAVIHKTIKKVTEDVDSLKMNTAIAAMMTMVNELNANGCTRGDLKYLLLLLNPFAPHITEELWENLGFAAQTGKMCCQAEWPVADESKTVASTVELAVQVNGKLKGTISMPTDSEEKAVVDAALAVEKVRKATEGMQIIKTILVKNRLVNLIVKPAK